MTTHFRLIKTLVTYFRVCSTTGSLRCNSSVPELPQPIKVTEVFPMAKQYGVPASTPLTLARKRLSTGMMVAAVAVVVLSMTLGILMGLSLVRKELWFVITVVMLCVCAAGVFLLRVVDRHITALLAESRRFQRGADAELLIGWLLEDLPDSYHVFHSIRLRKGTDTDHVVIGPSGIHLISTKNLRGLVAYDSARGLLHNGQPAGHLIRQALGQAMDLRDRLKALTQGDPYVNAILALPWAWLDVKGPVDHVWILNRDTVTKYFEGTLVRLDTKQIETYAKALRMLAETSQEITPAVGRSAKPTPAAGQQEQQHQ